MSRLNKGAAEQRFPLPALLQKLACAMAVALALVCVGAYAPTTAQALETAKITARPNTGSGSAVVGGTETRITWEVQADADEELSGLSLTFVDGTTFGTDDTRLTMLSGEDLMDRTPMKPTCKADGQTLKIDFGETAPAGGFFRVEVYGVTFPVEGGDEAFSGTYTLADGSTKKISKIPSVEIKGVTAFDNFLADLKEQPWVEAWNSNMFLRLFLNPVILVQSLPIVFKGFLMSLSIVLVAFPLAIPFGFALSLMRISKSRILRCLAGIYVNVIRGTPAFLQIYIAFFGLPLAGVKVDDYVLGVIVMAMNSSAYLCEIFRAGIQSIPQGPERGRSFAGYECLPDAALRYDSADVPQCPAYADQRVYPALQGYVAARRRGRGRDRHERPHHRGNDGLHYAVCGCRPVLSGHYPAACALGERSRGEAAGYGRNQKEASHQERRTGCRDARRPYRWSVRRFYYGRNQ